MRLSCYGFLGSGNLGNDASFETVLAWLRRERPDVRVSATTIAPEEMARRYGVATRPLRSGRGRLADVGATVAATGSTDAVVVPGMGVLEETLGVRFWGLPYWLLLTALAARLRGRGFVLLAIGAEPVRSRLTRLMFAATVRLATHVSCRDDLSAAAVASWSRPGRSVAVVPDLVFAHPALVAPAPAEGSAGVVVGVLDYHGWADDREAGTAEHARYVASMTQVVCLLLEAGDAVTLTGGDGVDVAVAQEIVGSVLERRPGARVGVRTVDDYTDLVALMASAEAVIGTRYHNLIAALSTARPTVAVAYAGKSERLLASFGLTGCSQPIDTIDPDALVRRLADLRARPGLVADLATRAEAWSVRVSDTIADVVADLERRG